MANLDKYECRNPVQRWLIAHFLRRVGQLAVRVGPRSVLDAGCGEGFVQRFLAGRLGPATTVAGVDLSAEALATARDRSGSAPLLRGSVLQLPFASEQFDLVVCTEVLEHLHTPHEALDELCRVSARYLLLSVPREPFFAGLNLLRGKNLRRLGSDDDHHQHWTRWGFLRTVGRRLRVLEAPQDTFPWTLVLAEHRDR